MNRKMLTAALGAAVLVGFTTVVRAETGQMRVDLAGVDLGTVDGAKAALSRITSSADAFCDDVPGRQTLDHEAAVHACVTQMTRKSVDALHAPTVTALLDGRTPPAAAVAVAQK
jgi:UrcA family protein